MPVYLRQSTASQEVPLGQFVDDTDGKTAETALSIANTDIKLWLTGATTLANKNSGGATHISGGIYYCVLDATDTATIGPMIIFVAVTGALAVRVECVVLAASVYDVIFGTTAPSTHTAAAVQALVAAGAVASVTGNVGGNVAGSVGSVVGAVGSVTGLNVSLIDVAISSRLATSGYAAPLDAAGVRTAIGLGTANLDTQLDAIPTNSDLSTALAAADDATLAAIAALNNITVAAVAAQITTDHGSGSYVRNTEPTTPPTANEIADTVFRRRMSSVEGSAYGETLHKSSLYGIIQAMQESNTTDNTGYLTVFKTDGTTELGRLTLASDADAEPITGVS